jgi:hypothetical protein
MLGRLAIVLVVGAFGLAPASAAASPRDVASTHAYLEADHAVLAAVVSGWPSDEASIRQFDSKIKSECPSVAAGSPQSEEEQKLSTEVVGTLWATVYHKNAGLIQRFAKAVSSLTWSNSAIARGVRRYTKGLHEMVALQMPDLCADVRAWVGGGFKATPSSTDRFVRRVEAIEVKELPQRLLAPYIAPSDRGLAARVAHLATRNDELEFTRGESDWNTLLEVLALNQ